MTDRITADILVEAFDLALPDFDDLKDRIEEAAAAHKATLTVDGRRYPAAATPVPPPADRAALRQRIAATRNRLFGVRWATAEQFGAALDEYTDAVLAVLPAPADRAAVPALTQTQRDMLRYALDLAEEQMLCVGDEFSENDYAAVDSLRRLAAEAPPACAECGHPHAAHREGDDPVTPGMCSACSDDDDRHDYVAAAEARPTTQPEDGTRTADLLAGSATEYRVPVPEGGGTNLIVRRQSVAFGAGWSVAVPGWGGGRAWTAEGWQDSISALSVDRLFCWPDADTAVTEARRALAADARQDGAQNRG